MSDQSEPTIYERIGEEAFERFVAAFYCRIPSDPFLGPLYPEDDLADAEQRLRDFLVFRFGGPARYIEERGHPRLRMRHATFPITQAARDRWVELMEAAMDGAEIPEKTHTELREFFAEAATFLINR